MSETDLAFGKPNEAGRYEIRLKGHLDARWAAWFDNVNLMHDSEGSTVIHGSALDQAALHGLLQKVRDIGLPLVSVVRLTPDSPVARPNPEPQPLTHPPINQGA